MTALTSGQTLCFFQASPEHCTTINTRSRGGTNAHQLDLYYTHSTEASNFPYLISCEKPSGKWDHGQDVLPERPRDRLLHPQGATDRHPRCWEGQTQNGHLQAPQSMSGPSCVLLFMHCWLSCVSPCHMILEVYWWEPIR